MADDFVVHLGGNVTLGTLDKRLKEAKLESYFNAPKDYSINKILSENWDNESKKSCLGLKLQHHDGTVTKTGGQVIKNVSGYDLSKIYIGSCNDFAIITEAYLKLRKLPQSQIKLIYQVDKFPEDLSKYTFDWDNLSITATCDRSVQKFIFTYLLYGEKELLELRKNKIKARLGEAFELQEGVYQGKDYLTSNPRIEISTQVQDLYNIFQICKQTFPDQEIKIDISARSINISLADLVEPSSINKLAHKDYYAQIYPKTKENRDLEKKLNVHINYFEDKIIEELKEVFKDAYRVNN